MKNYFPNMFLAGLLPLCLACTEENAFDAAGSFEAEEILISAEANGRITALNLEEGQMLQAGQVIGYIDSLQLFLKKKQLEAQVASIRIRQPDIPVQLAVLEEQLKTAEREKVRVKNLVEGNAAPTKQLDDLEAQIGLLRKQIEAQKSTLTLTREGLQRDIAPLQIQIEQIDDQLAKCRIVNPVSGTVLGKYAETHEMTAVGKPLYKIADLTGMILRAYITGSQLPSIRLNQEVQVFTDNGDGGYYETTGIITWISDKAEFTPKTIQTKEERSSKVYAVKVKVANDGTYKIGMYGELKFIE